MVVVRGGGGGAMSKILQCVHSANINQKLYFLGGRGSFVLQMHFFTVHR